MAGTELANGLTADEKTSSLLAEQIRECSLPVPVSPSAVTTTPVPSVAHPAPGSAQLTTAQLKARLLTRTDLSGYVPFVPQGDFPSYSDKPTCVATLNDLSSASAPSAAVTQARAAFAASPDGPWIEEVLRSYPGQGAAQAFAVAMKSLAGCGTFTLGQTAAAGTESVEPREPVNLGTVSSRPQGRAALEPAGIRRQAVTRQCPNRIVPVRRPGADLRKSVVACVPVRQDAFPDQPWMAGRRCSSASC